LKRKFPKTGKRTLYNEYYKRVKGRGKNPLLFCPPALDQRKEMKDNRYPVTNLAGVCMVSLIRNPIDRNRNPYDLDNKIYFDERRIEMTIKFMDTQAHIHFLLKRQKGLCGVCKGIISNEDALEVHHIKPLSEGGKNTRKNQLLVHLDCHRNHIHGTNDDK
jgi:RNA-directed DNA polymerase